MCIGRDGYKLCVNEATSDEETGDRRSFQIDGDDDFIELVFARFNRPPNALYLALVFLHCSLFPIIPVCALINE